MTRKYKVRILRNIVLSEYLSSYKCNQNNHLQHENTDNRGCLYLLHGPSPSAIMLTTENLLNFPKTVSYTKFAEMVLDNYLSSELFNSRQPHDNQLHLSL